MEPTSRQMRAILPLLKARITARSADGFTISFGPEYGSPTTIRISMPTARFDLRDGDILTLYTEVLLNAQPSPTSVQ